MKHTVYDNFLGTSCSFIRGLYSVGKIQHAVTLINPSVAPKKTTYRNAFCIVFFGDKTCGHTKGRHLPQFTSASIKNKTGNLYIT